MKFDQHRHRDRLDDVVSVLEKWKGEWMLDLNNALFVELGNGQLAVWRVEEIKWKTAAKKMLHRAMLAGFYA